MDIITLQSYTPNVQVVKYSPAFAYRWHPGTFLKIKFLGVIIELLIYKAGGRVRNPCVEKAPGTSDGEGGLGAWPGSASRLLHG